jgi:sugar phosphate isomerase/epimerase
MLKDRLPFRLGTTSYVIPDEIIPNVRFLSEKVDDVEIVLFETGGLSNIPSTEIVRDLKSLAADRDLTYTVHLPIDIHTGHADTAERRRAVEACRRIIDRMAPVEPFAYVLHLAGDRRGDSPSDDLLRWRALHRDSVRTLIQELPPKKLCIENLDYPFETVSGIVRELGLSVCTDIGHLLLCARDVSAHLDRHLAETRVVHLHGIEDGVDHRSAHHLDPGLLKALMNQLVEKGATERVVTLEIFNEEDLRASTACIAEWWHRRAAAAGTARGESLP